MPERCVKELAQDDRSDGSVGLLRNVCNDRERSIVSCAKLKRIGFDSARTRSVVDPLEADLRRRPRNSPQLQLRRRHQQRSGKLRTRHGARFAHPCAKARRAGQATLLLLRVLIKVGGAGTTPSVGLVRRKFAKGAWHAKRSATLRPVCVRYCATPTGASFALGLRSSGGKRTCATCNATYGTCEVLRPPGNTW